MLREYKHKLLLDYIKYVGDGPKQGTEEWLARRKKTIGGSEMSTVVGVNRYNSIYNLLMNKVGIGEGFIGDIKTRWGNLFEDVLCKYVEHDLHTEIVGDEIFIPGLIAEQSYSPDGLGVVEFDEEITHNGNVYKYREVFSILFEFKCPFSRIPNGVVPEYYIPQVKAGLDTIPVVDMGIFVEAVIRRCAIEHLGYNATYDLSLSGRNGRPMGTKPLAYGFVAFIQKSERLDKYNSNKCEFTDFGSAAQEKVEEILEAAVSIKNVAIHYSRPVYGEGKDTTAEDLAKIKDTAIGVLPWKLFRVDYHKIDRTDGYIDEHADRIKEIIGIVDKCMKVSADLRKKIIHEYIYGNNNDPAEDDK